MKTPCGRQAIHSAGLSKLPVEIRIFNQGMELPVRFSLYTEEARPHRIVKYRKTDPGDAYYGEK